MRNARPAKRAELARYNAKQRCWKVRNCHCSQCSLFVCSFSLVCVSSAGNRRAKFSTRIARSPERLDPPSNFSDVQTKLTNLRRGFRRIIVFEESLEEIERKNEAGEDGGRRRNHPRGNLLASGDARLDFVAVSFLEHGSLLPE